MGWLWFSYSGGQYHRKFNHMMLREVCFQLTSKVMCKLTPYYAMYCVRKYVVQDLLLCFKAMNNVLSNLEVPHRVTDSYISDVSVL